MIPPAFPPLKNDFNKWQPELNKLDRLLIHVAKDCFDKNLMVPSFKKIIATQEKRDLSQLSPMLLKLQKLYFSIVEIKNHMKALGSPKMENETASFYKSVLKGKKAVELAYFDYMRQWKKQDIMNFAKVTYQHAQTAAYLALKITNKLIPEPIGIESLIEEFNTLEEFQWENQPQTIKDLKQLEKRIETIDSLFTWKIFEGNEKQNLLAACMQLLALMQSEKLSFLNNRDELIKDMSLVISTGLLDQSSFNQLCLRYNQKLIQGVLSFQVDDPTFKVRLSHLLNSFKNFNSRENPLSLSLFVLKIKWTNSINGIRRALMRKIERHDLQVLFDFIAHYAAFEVFWLSQQTAPDPLKEAFLADIERRKCALSSALLAIAQESYRGLL